VLNFLISDVTAKPLLLEPRVVTVVFVLGDLTFLFKRFLRRLLKTAGDSTMQDSFVLLSRLVTLDAPLRLDVSGSIFISRKFLFGLHAIFLLPE
jgi:hypothetical protein